MIISTEWINDLLDTDLADDDMIAAIEDGGIEVEGRESTGNFSEHFVVGEIKSVKEHPNADRLNLAEVTLGKKTLQIVCGADNIKVGDKVPVALPGAELPDGTEIKPTEIRQAESEGMLCSAKELNLGHDHSGIFILDTHIEVGTQLNQVIESSTIVDLRTAANRADLQSVWGVAREVSAQNAIKVEDFSAEPIATSNDSLFSVSTTKRTPAYSLLHLESQSAVLDESPHWMQQRLMTAGLQPKGLLVDVTNYVMLETGQPLHAFDADKVDGKITVRMANKDETLRMIDGTQLKLNPKDMVIADSQKPLALAGVMGGKASEVSAETQNILLESANFDGSTVRLSALRHHLRTEASARFERGLNPRFMDVGINRLLEILEEYADVELIDSQRWEVDSKKQQSDKITVETGDYESVIGHSITPKEMKQFLQRLSIKHQRDGNTFIVQPPWWREDLVIKEDVIEELMKLQGLEEISSDLPHWDPDLKTERNIADFDFEKSLRSFCMHAGLSEVVTYSFIGDDEESLLLEKKKRLPQLLNPRSSEQKYLRGSLLASLVNAANSNRKTTEDILFFEISNVFKKEGNQVAESKKLGIIARSTDSVYTCKGVLDVIANHFNFSVTVEDSSGAPALAANAQGKILIEGVKAGTIGKLRKDLTLEYKLSEDVAYLELDIATMRANTQEVRFKPPRKFQSAFRDLTILIEKTVQWSEIKEVVESVDGVIANFNEEYQDPDKYGEEKKALTLHLELFDPQKTLTESEIEEILTAITEKLRKAHQIEII